MTQPTSQRAFVHEQTFDAPRVMVFGAWTDPDQLARWWGPQGMSLAVSEASGGAGGSIRYAMGAGDFVMQGRLAYLEVTPPDRLVIVDTRLDAAGEPVSADGFPAQLRYDVTFTEEGARTTVAIRVTPIAASDAERAAFEAHMDSLGGGFRGAFEKLAEYLADERPAAGRLTLTREYEASRDLVFRAWTDGAALARWWGPRGATLEVVTADIRPGGLFHFAMVAAGQETTWGRLAYREVTPERIVLVSSFADARGNVVPVPFMEDFPLELLVSATFVEAAGRTTVTLDVAPLSATPAEQTAFESLLPSMAEGFGNALDVLAGVLGPR